jgi:outer membrane murein-binding lipoprotein Lpp
MKKVILVVSVLSMVMFSGCSSDTKESLESEMKTLIVDCYSMKYTKEECREKGKELGEKIKDFNKGVSPEERIGL